MCISARLTIQYSMSTTSEVILRWTNEASTFKYHTIHSSPAQETWDIGGAGLGDFGIGLPISALSPNEGLEVAVKAVCLDCTVD